MNFFFFFFGFSNSSFVLALKIYAYNIYLEIINLLANIVYLMCSSHLERSRLAFLIFEIVFCSFVQALGDQIIFVTRPDKKKILFYNDKHCQFTVDEGM